MKLDDEYSHIKVCPETGDELNHDDLYNTDGVCPKCGDISYMVTHFKIIAGRYRRPNLVEFLFQGNRTEFFTKEEEDKVLNTLKGEF